MTAPVAHASGTAAGRPFSDGGNIKITFSSNPTISLWELEVKPPGVKADDKKDITNNRNVTWRTFGRGQLKMMTDITALVQYDPVYLEDIYDQVNVDDTITVEYDDGTTEAVYGWLDSFEPSRHKRGEMPTAEIVIVVANRDPDTCDEEAPVIVAGSGTSPNC